LDEKTLKRAQWRKYQKFDKIIKKMQIRYEDVFKNTNLFSEKVLKSRKGF